MKFSFVIPTYNNKKLLKNTLEALNYQRGFDREDYEVIIVDDGSSDNTGEYIQGINKNYEIKYYYLERNNDSCRARTRNCGWRNAKGDIVVFIDSDIIVKPSYLSELTRYFAVSQDIFVIGNRLMLDEDINFSQIGTGEIFNKYCFDSQNFDRMDFRYFLFETTSYNMKAVMCPWMQVYSCNLAVPRSVLEVVGGFDENFKNWGLEDVELGYALFKSKLKIVVNPRLEVLHQYHGERNDLVVMKDKEKGYEENIDYFLTKHADALKMEKKYAYRMLKGEISPDKILMDVPTKTLTLEFHDKSNYESFKDEVLSVLYKEEVRLVIHDYVEDSDLDIWVQLLDTKVIPKYYPISLRIDQKQMIQYLKAERERQKTRV